MAALGTGKNDHGVPNRPVHHGARDGGYDDDKPDRTPLGFWPGLQIEPIDLLGAIALVGMLIYALIYRMEPMVAEMLKGLFCVLLGRTTKRNGNGKQIR